MFIFAIMHDGPTDGWITDQRTDEMTVRWSDTLAWNLWLMNKKKREKRDWIWIRCYNTILFFKVLMAPLLKDATVRVYGYPYWKLQKYERLKLFFEWSISVLENAGGKRIETLSSFILFTPISAIPEDYRVLLTLNVEFVDGPRNVKSLHWWRLIH